MSRVKNVFLHTFKEKVLQSDKPCMVKFYSNNCGLCMGLESVFEDLCTSFNQDVVFYKVNVDVEKRLADLFSKSGVPTLMYFSGGRGSELSWPSDPDPVSGYNFFQLSKYLTKKLTNEGK